MTFPVPIVCPDVRVPHRYWRLLFTANNGDAATMAVTEIEMYENAYAVNVLSGGTIASSSNYNTTWVAAKAVDYSYLEPGWASGTGSHINSWLSYDFGAGNLKSINGIGISCRLAAEIDQAPSAISVQYSDDNTNWFTSWTVSGASSWSGLEFRRFINPATKPGYSGSPWGMHSYWRVLVTNSEGASSPAIGELQMRAIPGGANQCSGGTPSASSVYSATYSADKAFDGSNTTLWASNAAVAWLQYQFASPVSVAEITIKARHDNTVTTSPKIFLLQFADSGSGPWSTVFRKLSETGWVLSETRTYTDPLYI